MSGIVQPTLMRFFLFSLSLIFTDYGLSYSCFLKLSDPRLEYPASARYHRPDKGPVNTQKLWLAMEERGCFTDSQWAAGIFPDRNNSVKL